MPKAILIGGAMVTVGLLAGGVWMWQSFNAPFYRPGMVAREEGLTASLLPPAQSVTAERWLVETGIQLRHFAEGNGTPVLVIHGGPGMPSAEPWPALTLLSNEYRFHYYDQRGCGESTRPFDRFEAGNTYRHMLKLEQTLGLGAQIADIERIRQILGEEKITLVGHSFGGFTAALYAAEFPERVAALVLLAPADVLVLPNPDGDLFTTVEQRLPPEQRNDYRQWKRRYLDFGKLFSYDETGLLALNAEFGSYYAMATTSTQTPPAQGRPGGWMVQAQYLSMGRRHDYREALRQISAPTLVVHGSSDLQPVAASRQYADLISAARFVQIDGAGHFMASSHADELAGVLADFLRAPTQAHSPAVPRPDQD
jgi:proline iminopeptidase